MSEKTTKGLKPLNLRFSTNLIRRRAISIANFFFLLLIYEL
jgi:hypothetical protein